MNMEFKALCQDCEKVAVFSSKEGQIKAHHEEVKCECGGQFCACTSCLEDIGDLVKGDVLKRSPASSSTEYKDFSFYWGNNEQGKPDSIASLLIKPGEMVIDASGSRHGKFMELELSREKLREILKVLDDDFEKMSRHAFDRLAEVNNRSKE